MTWIQRKNYTVCQKVLSKMFGDHDCNRVKPVYDEICTYLVGVTEVKYRFDPGSHSLSLPQAPPTAESLPRL